MRTKEVLTTGQLAKMCLVSQQTIIRCFDAGLLKGFRVPGSRFRRIPWKNAINFMKENRIPLPSEQRHDSRRSVLVVSPCEDICVFLKGALPSGIYRTTNVGGGFAAGRQFEKNAPDLIIVDFAIPDAWTICHALADLPASHSLPVIAAVDSSFPPCDQYGLQIIKIHDKPVNSSLVDSIRELLDPIERRR